VEKFSRAGRHLQFELSTIREQPCGNFYILADWEQTPKLLTLNISGLEKSGPCIGNASLARGTVLTKSLGEGTWPLDILLQYLIRNPGKLVVQKGTYQLQMESTHGISLLQRELRQIPSGTLWGYVAYRPELAATARNFSEEFRKLSKSPSLEDGDYGYFTLSNNTVKPRDIPPGLTAIPLLRSQGSDIDLLLNLVNSYRKNFPENLLIKLSDTLGNEY